MIKYERGFKVGRQSSASFLVHTVPDEAHVKCTSTLYKDANASLPCLKILQLVQA